ncbi:hypothetical protein EMPS_05630 [Entomortierella parvispora]|uniref:Protein kinase domain-containing protein n=1 Tax=Entomortierella parvispora TaxID=205924 RepID=A0A9P3HAV6_9FUNG|nr:hypothetical protein EMPS_05630 [Entomortierella parvispora]
MSESWTLDTPTSPIESAGTLKECPYVYTSTCFARGRHGNIHRARRKNIPANAPGNNLAVKVIYKTSLLDYVELPAEERAKMTKEEQEEWDAEYLDMMQKWLHPLFKETYVHKRLNDHPHVLKYVDHFWTSTKLHIVTELAMGSDLQIRLNKRILAQRGGYSEAELIPMFRILCDTLAYIHSRNCVHRDIKPSNILFRTQGNEELVIGDFGFSAMLEEHRPNLTTTNVGTARFMAPEQARKMPHGSPVDMWALGVNCYYFLTTQHPIRPSASSIEDETEPYIIDQEGIEAINWAGVSFLAKSFIRGLLVMDPTLRMTAEQARKHLWLGDIKICPEP